MASSIVLRRASVATFTPLFNRLIHPMRSVSVAPSAIRSFNTDAQMTTYEGDDRSVDVNRRDRSVSPRRDSVPSFFSDVFDPFSPPRSLSQMLNLMDQFMENPFLAASRGMGAGVGPRGWDVKEDDDALYIRMDMPGIDKENVKITVEQNTLIIRGEAEKETEEGEYGRRYSTRLDLPSNLYKLDQIKAEMKNGVLKVQVPKVREEERTDVRQVKVE